MESAFAWLGQLVNWFSQFFPRFVLLDSTQGAVKFEGFFLPSWLRMYFDWFHGFNGTMRFTQCGPGLHWYWPATTSFQVYPTEYQTDNLPSQTIETSDGKSISVGGMVTYTVPNLMLLLPRTHSAVKMVQVKVLAAIHEVLCKMSWDQLTQEQRKGTLNTKLRHAAQKQLTEFGVKIEECMLTDLARSRVYRLIQSTQSDDV